jgi:hypothetical protein
MKIEIEIEEREGRKECMMHNINAAGKLKIISSCGNFRKRPKKSLCCRAIIRPS